PATADSVAQNIVNVTDAELIPLVSTGNPAQALETQIQTKLEAAAGPNWAPTIASILGEIFGNVNMSAAQMTSDETAEVLAGLTALESGCKLFLGGKLMTFRGIIARTAYAKPLPAPAPASSCANGRCGMITWTYSPGSAPTCSACQATYSAPATHDAD